MTDVVSVDENGRYQLRLERHLAHQRADVWQAVLELRRRSSRAHRCSHAAPPALLEYKDETSLVRWEVIEDGPTRSTLVFTHRCGSRQDGIDDMGWWLTELEVLADMLDGHPVSDFHQRATAMTSRCRCAFG
ncbi:hypothetical protein ACFTWF_39555 [Rhodococcus sp. NPDC056960]|uniref:hypothetical protein n=1 Tax=Rhodococcus sp. NPDC056960 TaxID=3345982 RepID=UPI00362AEDC3